MASGGGLQLCALLREHRRRRAEAGHGARPRVQAQGDPVEIALRPRRQIEALRKMPAHRPVHVPVGGALPGRVPIAEIHVQLQRFGQFLVPRHLAALVMGEARPHRCGHLAKLAREARQRGMGRAILHLHQLRKRLLHSTGVPAALAFPVPSVRPPPGRPAIRGPGYRDDHGSGPCRPSRRAFLQGRNKIVYMQMVHCETNQNAATISYFSFGNKIKVPVVEVFQSAPAGHFASIGTVGRTQWEHLVARVSINAH